ncbi:MAG: sigma-70 family RNA polymerase sigma factor [Candidatus Paceibacterota bacterium]|jgi:RNA polymerase sigma factor (sigma-70 family)
MKLNLLAEAWRRPRVAKPTQYVNLLRLYEKYCAGDKDALRKFVDTADGILLFYLDNKFPYYLTIEDLEDAANRAIAYVATHQMPGKFKSARHLLNYLEAAARTGAINAIQKSQRFDKGNAGYASSKPEEIPKTPEPLVPLDKLLDAYRKYYAEQSKIRQMPPMARSVKILQRRANGQSLEEIGNDLGITRERVRQIEARGIRNLQVFAQHYTSDN